MCYKGLGVPKDEEEALRWYLRAVRGGHGPSQRELGIFYPRGIGGPVDFVAGDMWLTLASAAGHVKGSIESIHSYMTPEQIEEAHKRVREWKPTGTTVAQTNPSPRDSQQSTVTLAERGAPAPVVPPAQTASGVAVVDLQKVLGSSLGQSLRNQLDARSRELEATLRVEMEAFERDQEQLGEDVRER